MTRWILGSVVFVMCLAVTGFIGFYVAVFLIGPHSDILPEVIHVPVGIILLFIIIGTPAWLSRLTFKHFKLKEKSSN